MFISCSLTNNRSHCCLHGVNLRVALGSDMERNHLVTGQTAEYLGINAGRSSGYGGGSPWSSFLIASLLP